MLVLLQGQLLVTAGLKCINGIKLWKETQFRCSKEQIVFLLIAVVWALFDMLKKKSVICAPHSV